MTNFDKKIQYLLAEHEALLSRPNVAAKGGNGIYTKYENPILTGAHTPVIWRYDLDEKTNPFLMERIGMNAAFNSGAMKWNDKYLLVVRVEGTEDRKSVV